MKRLAHDIKNGTFSNVYLLCGEEEYLRKQYKDNLKNAIVLPDDSMNCSVYSGKDIDVGEVIDMAGTMPFFAERRVIVIENSGWCKSGNERMAEFVKSIPETTYMIFVEEDVDKRNKLYKAIASKGYCALCEIQDEALLKKWILGILKKENKLITADALDLLIGKTGTKMENIRNELEKLICYKYYDEGITAADVEELCVEQIQNKIFEMVEAVALKDQKKALSLYYDLIALKEAPVKILALIARQFNILLQVREMSMKGYPESEIAARTGLNRDGA
jgi:DNA polymerase-3 subunit delta